MYDLKCRDLALAFLEDSPTINTPEHASALAQHIQDNIESYISWEEAKARTIESLIGTKAVAAAKEAK